MKTKTLIILMLFLTLLPLGAQSFTDYIYLSYNGSIVFLASDNGPTFDPPQIVPSFGFSAAYSIIPNLRVEFTEDIYFSNYEIKRSPGYPMACSLENSEAFVLGFTTGLQATGFFPINENETSLRVFGGVAADLRIVTHSLGLAAYYQNQNKPYVEAINNYFWSEGRMFFASMGIGIDFPFSHKQILGFDLRVWAPLYRLWTDEDLPAIDGWRFSAGIRISPRKPLHPPRPTRAPRQHIDHPPDPDSDETENEG